MSENTRPTCGHCGQSIFFDPAGGEAITEPLTDAALARMESEMLRAQLRATDTRCQEVEMRYGELVAEINHLRWLLNEGPVQL